MTKQLSSPSSNAPSAVLLVTLKLVRAFSWVPFFTLPIYIISNRIDILIILLATFAMFQTAVAATIYICYRDLILSFRSVGGVSYMLSRALTGDTSVFSELWELPLPIDHAVQGIFIAYSVVVQLTFFNILLSHFMQSYLNIKNNHSATFADTVSSLIMTFRRRVHTREECVMFLRGCIINRNADHEFNEEASYLTAIIPHLPCHELNSHTSLGPCHEDRK